MSGVEKSHNDIFRRVEQVELDVAVLDSKTNRLHQDLMELKVDTKINGEISREVKTKVDSLPRFIVISIAAFGLLFAALTYVTGMIQ